MDVAILTSESLKLKIRKTNLIVDPQKGMGKNEADAIIATGIEIDETRVNNSRITIRGVGEYEINGLKISALKSENELVFSFNLDGKNIVLARASALSNLPPDKVQSFAVVIINANGEIPEKVVTAMEARIIIFYGKNAREAAKAFGKENIKASSKISVSEDRLPEETEVYLLS